MNTPVVEELPPFAGGSNAPPSRYEEARIEGVRRGQLELGAPSTIPGMMVTSRCSPADVFAAERAAGVIPLALRRPPPPGSLPGTPSQVVVMGPRGCGMHPV